ncbi:MAG TPA: methyltransferase domain-containing protein [Nitrososphaeraceae archaeon]|nr:methyltransferase domain-containing protein [Nitrososphaeraceae archaeon]
MKYRNKGSWDARTYDQVSRLVQYKWGQHVIKWRKWLGNEVVMDAGCGSGLLTKELAKQVPRGKIYAVDLDSNMIKQAKNNLKSFDNVEIIQSSFTDVKLPTQVDVIFSNSALHWVLDHRKAFQNFWEMLKPMKDSDSQLLVQCGGYGNLQQTITVLERIAYSDSFKSYFADWKQPWYFAKPEDTSKLLREIGYVNTKVYYSDDVVILPNQQIYSKFVKTVVMKPYLDHLSSHNADYDTDKLKDVFLGLFLDEVENYSGGKLNKSWSLDFVRLNIIAHKSHA